MKRSLFMAAATVLLLTLPAPATAVEKTVTVYAARHSDAEKALYAEFQQKTGIVVSVVHGKAGELIDRMKQEKDAPQADLFISVDGGILDRAKKAGLLQPITSESVLENIPAALRDKENTWVGLSTRARVIVYAKERVNPKDISTYADLAAPKWKGKVLMRPGAALYNQSFLATMVALDGEKKTAAFVKGLAANFARAPKGGDRGQAKDIADGLGDVTLMNTYYIGRMLTASKPEEREAARKVGIIFPDQKGAGAHINVNGIALVKNAKNKANAVALVEFMSSTPAQEVLSAKTFEFPANPRAKKPELLESWGAFKAQSVDFAVMNAHNATAAKIAQENGWE